MRRKSVPSRQACLEHHGLGQSCSVGKQRSVQKAQVLVMAQVADRVQSLDVGKAALNM